MKKVGFTLVELVIVIAILGIIVIIAMPFYLGVKTKAHKSALIAETRNYKLGQIMYHQKNKVYASTRTQLENDIIPEGFEPALNDVIFHVNSSSNPDNYCVFVYESRDDSAQGRFCYYATNGMTSTTCPGIGANFTTLEINCNF